MQNDALNATFAALSDPTRRAILVRLADGAASVQELTEPFGLSQPAISKHLKVLEAAGLVARQQQGQKRPRVARTGKLEEALTWIRDLRRMMVARHGNLDTALEEMKASVGHREGRRQ